MERLASTGTLSLHVRHEHMYTSWSSFLSLRWKIRFSVDYVQWNGIKQDSPERAVSALKRTEIVFTSEVLWRDSLRNTRPWGPVSLGSRWWVSRMQWLRLVLGSPKKMQFLSLMVSRNEKSVANKACSINGTSCHGCDVLVVIQIFFSCGWVWRMAEDIFVIDSVLHWKSPSITLRGTAYICFVIRS